VSEAGTDANAGGAAGAAAATLAPTRIHPTAVVDAAAEVGAGVEIGPYAVVEGGVTIADGCRIVGQCWIFRGTALGAGCAVYPGAVLGAPPQDFHFRGEESFVRIGPGTVVREGAQVHRATAKGGVTAVGARCLIMANGHVGHECRIGDDVVICNNALASGHVEIGDRAFISGNVSIHQFTRVGRLAMIGGNAAISRDLPPFLTAAPMSGNRVLGVNTIGLRRAGIGAEARLRVKNAFRRLYLSGLLFLDALAELDADETPEVRELIAFIRASRRGALVKAFKRRDDHEEEAD